MKVLANDGISSEGVIALEEAGNTVITNTVSQGDLVNYINENSIDVIDYRRVDKV